MKVPDQLKSRKFWLAAFGLIAAIVLGVYGILTNRSDYVDTAVTLAISSITGYLLAEGAADTVDRLKNGQNVSSGGYDNLDDLNKVDTPIVSGGRYAGLKEEDDLDADDDEDN
jgi:hypothetical protein